MVFQALAVSRCETVLAWLSSAVVPHLSKLATLPFVDAEALLQLVAHFPARMASTNPTFGRLVVMLCQVCASVCTIVACVAPSVAMCARACGHASPSSILS